MKIYLIRHGETTGDLEDRYGGDYDDHLTEKGKYQAEKLGKYLTNKKIEIIYHSPRIRAKETAQILNRPINVKLEEVSELRERNAYGILTGLTKSEAKQKFPEEVAELLRDKLHHKVKSSEDYSSFKKRVITIFDKITIDKKYSVIAIVSHGGPISCIVREILELGEFKWLGDCGLLEIEKNNKKPNHNRVVGFFKFVLENLLIAVKLRGRPKTNNKQYKLIKLTNAGLEKWPFNTT